MADKQEFIELVQARQGMYETLASLYFDRLTEEQIREMASHDYRELIESENELISSGFNDIYRYLRKRNTGTRQELAVDFSSCFLGTHSYKGLVAQPYESLFLDPAGTLAGKPRKQVHNIYKSERVALRAGYDYPDDHLAFECEFMSIECARCVQAVQEGDMEEAARLIGVQQEFMDEHIGRWFQRLHDLSLKFIKTRFYRGLLNISQGFFDEESDTIRYLAGMIEEGLEEPEAEEGEGTAGAEAAQEVAAEPGEGDGNSIGGVTADAETAKETGVKGADNIDASASPVATGEGEACDAA